jgi:flagellar motility protein MotE (MotC chaperone)
MNMQSCDTKKTRASDLKGTVTIIICILCAFAFAFVLSATTDISSTQAAEKKINKKAATKKDANIVKGPATVSSMEEERLKILNSDLQAKIDQLKKLKSEMEEITKGFEAKKKEQVGKVVKMFEAMPAEEAAKAITRLDDETAVQILTSLKARSAGQILGQMDSDRVAVLSKKAILRGRSSKEKSSR